MARKRSQEADTELGSNLPDSGEGLAYVRAGDRSHGFLLAAFKEGVYIAPVVRSDEETLLGTELLSEDHKRVLGAGLLASVGIGTVLLLLETKTGLPGLSKNLASAVTFLESVGGMALAGRPLIQDIEARERHRRARDSSLESSRRAANSNIRIADQGLSNAPSLEVRVPDWLHKESDGPDRDLPPVYQARLVDVLSQTTTRENPEDPRSLHTLNLAGLVRNGFQSLNSDRARAIFLNRAWHALPKELNVIQDLVFEGGLEIDMHPDAIVVRARPGQRAGGAAGINEQLARKLLTSAAEIAIAGIGLAREEQIEDLSPEDHQSERAQMSSELLATMSPGRSRHLGRAWTQWSINLASPNPAQ